MGSGGDGEKQPPTDLEHPPVYQEKVPLPDGDHVVLVDRHPPVYVVPDNQRQKKKKCTKKRCCCCTGLAVLIVFLILTPMAVLHVLAHWWFEPHVHMELVGSSEHSHEDMKQYMTGQDIIMECHVKTRARYVPLVQWFHDANEAPEDGETTYKMFAVHNQVTDPQYQGRFEVVKTEAHKHGVKYTLVIKDAQPEDAGYYGCQVPKHHHHHGHHHDDDDEFVDELQCHSCSHSSSSSSSSSDSSEKHGDDNDSAEKRRHREEYGDDHDRDDDDDRDHDDDKDHDDDNDSEEKHGDKKKCFKGHNRDYVYVVVV